MRTGLVFFVIGLACGHQWPTRIGLAIMIGALAAVVACGYADRSPDEVFDLLSDYCEALVVYAFLPWAAGCLIGALWLVV